MYNVHFFGFRDCTVHEMLIFLPNFTFVLNWQYLLKLVNEHWLDGWLSNRVGNGLD